MLETAADVVVGLTWLLAGGLLVAAREHRRAGALMAATGLAWLAGSLVEGLALVHRGPLAHLLLTYPGAALGRPVDGLVVVAAYVEGLVLPVGRTPAATLLLAAAMLAVAVWRRERATGAVRRSRTVPLIATALVAGVLAAGAVGRIAAVSLDSWLGIGYDGVLLATALGLFADLLRGGWGRAAVPGLVIHLGAGGADTLAHRLARAVGDPSLDIAYALDDGVTFVDESGRPVVLPSSHSSRAVTRFDEGDRPVAAVTHDPAALRDPQLRAGAGAALRIAVANVRLQSDVRRRVREVQRSRRRLLDASDEQRRRVAAELDAGVIGHLDDAARMIALARDGDEDVEACELERRLAAATAQLRGLTLGLRPAGLEELGLGHALRQLVAHAPLDVALTVSEQRFPDELEATAWFVCSEALANVIKHAEATRVEIRIAAAGNWLMVEVDDDGRGGADPACGSGLRGLTARVESVGGALAVGDGAEGGTRLVAQLPTVPADD